MPFMQHHSPETDRPAGSVRAAAISGLIVLALAGCQPEQPPADESAPVGQAVRVAEVESNRAPTRLRLPGVTRAVDRADLAFLLSGQLAERLVRRGETVTVGQPLAVLTNPQLMPGVATAEARVRELREQLDQLERDTQRLDNLHQRGLVATEELDRVRARRNAAREALDQARAGLEEARNQLAEATLRAPFDGRIVDLPVEVGEFVSAGRPAVVLGAPERLEVAISLTAAQADAIEPGDRVAVRRLDGGGQVTGTVREVGLAAPANPARAVIDLPADEPGWAPGQSVHVALSFSGGQALQVPLDALIDSGSGLPQVFRVRDGRAEAVTVIPGRLDAGHVAVDGELEVGDRVVVGGQGQLLDGERVRVLE